MEGRHPEARAKDDTGMSFATRSGMDHQVPVDSSARADEPAHEGTHQILADLAYRRLVMVNVVYFGTANCGDRQWVLIDAGLPATAKLIADGAAHRFGEDARPAAIVLTHGHFDHTGALAELAERWDAPIYAHELERPFLDGSESYPPPDPTVGGGIMPLTSPLYPRGPIDVSNRLQTLPSDGTVPGMRGWQWIHTPGHAPGHVSFYRAADGAMIVGDAFITTNQESAYAVALQKVEMHGPPMYFTPDWKSARTSVETLAALDPEVVVCGHGRPLQGAAMRLALQTLADNFDEIAVPKHGKYVEAPATNDSAGDSHAAASP